MDHRVLKVGPSPPGPEPARPGAETPTIITREGIIPGAPPDRFAPQERTVNPEGISIRIVDVRPKVALVVGDLTAQLTAAYFNQYIFGENINSLDFPAAGVDGWSHLDPKGTPLYWNLITLDAGQAPPPKYILGTKEFLRKEYQNLPSSELTKLINDMEKKLIEADWFIPIDRPTQDALKRLFKDYSLIFRRENTRTFAELAGQEDLDLTFLYNIRRLVPKVIKEITSMLKIGQHVDRTS